jgi:hypothetical protein
MGLHGLLQGYLYFYLLTHRTGLFKTYPLLSFHNSLHMLDRLSIPKGVYWTTVKLHHLLTQVILNGQTNYTGQKV